MALRKDPNLENWIYLSRLATLCILFKKLNWKRQCQRRLATGSRGTWQKLWKNPTSWDFLVIIILLTQVGFKPQRTVLSTWHTNVPPCFYFWLCSNFKYDMWICVFVSVLLIGGIYVKILHPGVHFINILAFKRHYFGVKNAIILAWKTPLFLAWKTPLFLAWKTPILSI